jgi:tetratricopeptide (TPR) repeat protein
MKYLLFLLLTFGWFSTDSVCQVTDTVQIKQTKYNYVTGGSRTVDYTPQQLDARPHYLAGYKFVHFREFKKAIKPLKKAIEIDSTGNCTSGRNGMAHSELGHAYLRLKDYQNALLYLNQAIEINKLYSNPYLNKAVAQMEMGKNELAIETLNGGIELIPEGALLYVQRGYLHEVIGKYEMALKDFYKFLELVELQKQTENAKTIVDDVKTNIQKIEDKIKE